MARQICTSMQEDKVKQSISQVVLGLGGTVDFEIKLDETLLDNLVSHYKITTEDLKKIDFVQNERDLIITFLCFIKQGTGGEIFVLNSELLIQFAEKFKYKITLGGTCIRAGIVQSQFGRKCILHLVSINDHMRNLLPKDISYICSADQDTLDPHLIVQYNEGFKVNINGEILVASQPSRIIFTNDPPNRELVISSNLGKVLSQAPVFLISGFNCIQDMEILENRIAEIKTHMLCLPERAKVIFEDAGYHVEEIRDRAVKLLAEIVDIFGMNEDEMQNYLNRKLNLLDVNEIMPALFELAKKISAPILIIHSRYWSIAFGKGATELQPHLQAAIDVASTRFCFGDHIGENEIRTTKRNSKNLQAIEFAKELEIRLNGRGICLPGYEIHSINPTTIGLGDVFVGGLVGSLSGITFG